MTKERKQNIRSVTKDPGRKVTRQDAKRLPRIALSPECECVTEGSMHLLRKHPGKRKGYVGGKLRTFVRITPVGRDREYWASTTTGSLYCPTTLRCLSGDLRIEGWA